MSYHKRGLLRAADTLGCGIGSAKVTFFSSLLEPLISPLNNASIFRITCWSAALCMFARLRSIDFHSPSALTTASAGVIAG